MPGRKKFIITELWCGKMRNFEEYGAGNCKGYAAEILSW